LGSDIIRRDLDTSGQDALLNTLEGKQAKSETDGLERQMLLSKPQLASKIRKYQFLFSKIPLISRNLPS
jgi:flagellar motor switch protein FliG